MASDQEPENSDGAEEEAGAVVEREGLPDGPEASAALAVAPAHGALGADGPRRVSQHSPPDPFHE